MKNEVERLINGRRLEVESNKNLTENLRDWRTVRNITKADYLTFVANILEELLEPIEKNKNTLEKYKHEMIYKYFTFNEVDEDDVIDTIQDIQVFCINETELMGYDNIKCNNEVFQEINSREQDPQQFAEWQKFGANEKWQKDRHQKDWTLYKANYEVCKL